MFEENVEEAYYALHKVLLEREQRLTFVERVAISRTIRILKLHKENSTCVTP